MPVNEFTMPIVVPSSPTNGAVAPTVASTPRPRFSLVISISMLRSTARSAELMSATVTEPSAISGFTSPSAPPSTLVGAAFGALSGSMAYAATGGKRDFTSRSGVVATSYEVVCQAKVAEDARNLLGRLALRDG